MNLKFLFPFAMSFCCCFVAICNESEPSKTIAFDNLKGTFKMPAPGQDIPGDTVYVNYDIAWPVKGDPELVSKVQGWIISRIANEEHVWDGEPDVMQVIDSLAMELASNGGIWTKSIAMTVEENVPFDSFMTINLNEEDSWGFGYYTLNDISLTIRQSDGALLQADQTIGDKDEMGLIIGRHLEHEMKSVDPDWKPWNPEDPDAPINLPMREDMVRLSKDGVWVGFCRSDASAYVIGGYSCTIPYSELIPVLSKEAKDFFERTEF